MANPSSTPRWLMVLVWAGIFAGLYLSRLFHYALFHSLVEIFTMVIGFSVFTVAWSSRSRMENHQFLFLGISFLFTSLIDLFHTLAYKGMGVFVGVNANPATQLWIGARGLQALSIVFSFFFVKRKIHLPWALAVFSMLTAAILLLIVAGYFPSCYAEGSGLTAFKKVSEYVISALLLFGVVLLIKDRRLYDKNLLTLLAISFALMVCSEMMFTIYIDVYDVFNLLGHCFRLLAYYFVYKAIVETGVELPHRLLFRELSASEENLRQALKEMEKLVIMDTLTWLFNRRHLLYRAENEFQRAKRYRHPLAAMMLDVDKFKDVNDTFGHAAGDRVLAELGSCVKKALREVDLVGRYGGDEFAIFLPETGVEAALHAAKRVRDAVSQLAIPWNDQALTVTVSIGLAIMDGECTSAERLLDWADLALLEAKKVGKNQIYLWTGSRSEGGNKKTDDRNVYPEKIDSQTTQQQGGGGR